MPIFLIPSDYRKKQKMKTWFFSGDVNWLDHDGNWYFHDKNFSYIYCLEFLNWANNVGEHEAKEIGAKYCVSVKMINVADITIEDVKRAMGYCYDDQDLTPEILTYSLFAYGVGEQESSVSGNNSKQLIREARRMITNLAE